MFQSSSGALAGQLSHAGGAQAQAEAYGRMYRGMLSQASTLSYIDTFWLLGVITAIMFFASFLLRSNHPRKADAQAMAH
jgi:DHA2 family multidrug resistance protein